MADFSQKSRGTSGMQNNSHCSKGHMVQWYHIRSACGRPWVQIPVCPTLCAFGYLALTCHKLPIDQAPLIIKHMQEQTHPIMPHLGEPNASRMHRHRSHPTNGVAYAKGRTKVRATGWAPLENEHAASCVLCRHDAVAPRTLL